MKRPRHPMPKDVEEALEARGLTAAHRERPPYQQNDYVGWITGAKRPETRRKRLEQMLNELDEGGVYMGMPHNPSEGA